MEVGSQASRGLQGCLWALPQRCEAPLEAIQPKGETFSVRIAALQIVAEHCYLIIFFFLK